jgi:hypothetical protein
LSSIDDAAGAQPLDGALVDLLVLRAYVLRDPGAEFKQTLGEGSIRLRLFGGVCADAAPLHVFIIPQNSLSRLF